MAAKKSIGESTAPAVAFNSKHHSAHQLAYRSRRKAGMVAVQPPWHWLTQADVQRLAVEAYRSASYAFSQDLQSPCSTPESFVRQLQEDLEMLVADAAMAAGVPAAPAGSSVYASTLRAVPTEWRPQYPIFAPEQVNPVHLVQSVPNSVFALGGLL